MYAILRGDIYMPPGKAASQACHAILESHKKTPTDLSDAYHADGLGTKIILFAPDESALRETEIRATALGIPCALIIDKGHILPPDFNGKPIVTALGIGPITREISDLLTEGFEKY